MCLFSNVMIYNLSWKEEIFGQKIVNVLCTFVLCSMYQRPDHYTCQVSVYLPSISILILNILILKYWYFLFQKRTEILILQYYFLLSVSVFFYFFNDLVAMFEATKIILTPFYWSCVVKYAHIGFIWALDCVFHNKCH